jgi:hypothetical protein
MYDFSRLGFNRNKAMATNRISGYLNRNVFMNQNKLPLTKGFIPCPMFHKISSQQQSVVLEIYRLAEQLTREQLQPKPRQIAEFSIN